VISHITGPQWGKARQKICCDISKNTCTVTWETSLYPQWEKLRKTVCTGGVNRHTMRRTGAMSMVMQLWPRNQRRSMGHVALEWLCLGFPLLQKQEIYAAKDRYKRYRSITKYIEKNSKTRWTCTVATWHQQWQKHNWTHTHTHTHTQWVTCALAGHRKQAITTLCTDKRLTELISEFLLLFRQKWL